MYQFSTGLDFQLVIRVRDVSDDQKYRIDLARGKLKEEKEILERNKQEQIALRNASLSTLQSIREQMKEWQALKNGDSTYSISGPGLGWLDGKLATGQWVYYADTGKMTPVDREGIDLIGVLIAN